jgi:hypothetical protein
MGFEGAMSHCQLKLNNASHHFNGFFNFKFFIAFLSSLR